VSAWEKRAGCCKRTMSLGAGERTKALNASASHPRRKKRWTKVASGYYRYLRSVTPLSLGPVANLSATLVINRDLVHGPYAVQLPVPDVSGRATTSSGPTHFSAVPVPQNGFGLSSSGRRHACAVNDMNRRQGRLSLAGISIACLVVLYCDRCSSQSCLPATECTYCLAE
jgi:hypothetical protein